MKPYQDFGRAMARYWQLYGGWSALFSSVYLHVAVVIGLICYPLWWDDGSWSSIVLSAVPNLLGFSVGAFAIILSIGGRFIAILQNKDEAKSRYLGVVASFIHFIVVQTLALMVAVIGSAWPFTVIGAIGTILLVYAFALAVAAAMRLFRLARIYNVIPVDAAEAADKSE